MTESKLRGDREVLIKAIIEGIHRRKGLNIMNIDLSEIDNSQCDNYIICHGTSSTQTESLAQSVEETVAEILGEKPWHTDGYQNAQWILLDYANIMVHVFQEEYRNFYDLENLWADAKIEHIESEI